MKKILCLLLSLLLIGCSKEEVKNDRLKIIAPSGAPSLSLVEYINKYSNNNMTIVEGSDLLQAAFVQVDSEYDVIISPINLGCKLISTNNTNYKLLGVVTWGNLYLVENVDLQDGEIALFGESAIPGKIINDSKNFENATWYSSASEVSAALLSEKVKIGLLAEPVLTATISKAKANGINLEIVEDLNETYNQKHQTESYPQAALFVSEDTYNNKKEQIEDLVEYIKKVNKESMKSIAGYETFFGVNKAELIYDAYNRMNLYYKDAKDYEKEIYTFLELFGIKDFLF